MSLHLASRHRPAVRCFTCGVLLATLLTIGSGCRQNLATEYGQSKGRSGTHSINGFATLRQSFEQNAWESRDVHRLNDRLQSLDALVWTPTLHKADETEAVAWLQGWLDEHPRTLIYVLPDLGSELAYWESARELAPAEQRIEYRRRAARTLTQHMTKWAPGTIDPRDHSSLIERPWFRSERRVGMSPGWEVSGVENAPAGDRWHSEPLHETADGRALVMRITRDDGDAGGPRQAAAQPSQILVVAGGSLVSNFAMTTSTGQEIARLLVAHSTATAASSTRRIGFLRSGPEGVPVSDSDGPPTRSGMELLTVWPLSLITMHLALIAIVASLIVLPIFGRPRRVQERSASDFADHIRAIAALMQRTGGEAYAASRISEYFRRIRGETTGRWVLPETHDSPTPVSPQRPGSAPPQPSAHHPAGTLASHPEPVTDEPRIESPDNPARS